MPLGPTEEGQALLLVPRALGLPQRRLGKSMRGNALVGSDWERKPGNSFAVDLHWSNRLCRSLAGLLRRDGAVAAAAGRNTTTTAADDQEEQQLSSPSSSADGGGVHTAAAGRGEPTSLLREGRPIIVVNPAFEANGGEGELPPPAIEKSGGWGEGQ